jgi:uncharacterized protein
MAATSKSVRSRRTLRKPGKAVVKPLRAVKAAAKSGSKPKAKLKIRPKASRKRAARPFWEAKSLKDMSRPQWEQLCDGCGQCCMLKIEEEESGKIFITRLACKLLDIGSCRCSSYPDRHDFVPDCVVLKPETVDTYAWLPRTCAYRLLAEGKPLEWWHPLVSGDPDTVHQAGISVRTWARSEKGVKPSAITRYIIEEV